MEKQLKPKLRFPEFSNNYEAHTIESFFGNISSGKSKVFDEGQYYLYGSTGAIGTSNKYDFEGNKLLVARVGANAGSLYQVDGKYCVSDNTLMINYSNKANIQYLKYGLIQFNLNRLIFGTGQPLITGGQLKKLKLYFPNLPEQQKISLFLTEVDEKITKLTKKKDFLEQYKKGVMQKIFNQELRFKDDEGKAFPKWEKKKLGEISDVRDGTHDSPKYVKQGYPLITSKNLNSNGKLDFNDISFINELDYININKRSKVDIGDIIFGMIGTIGNPVLLKEDGFAIKNVALIKEKKIIHNLFLIHYLKSNHILKQFHFENSGGTQKFVSLGVIRTLRVLIPSIEEQTKIANFLSDIDLKIETLNAKIESSQAFKKGLLQQMFV